MARFCLFLETESQLNMLTLSGGLLRPPLIVALVAVAFVAVTAFVVAADSSRRESDSPILLNQRQLGLGISRSLASTRDSPLRLSSHDIAAEHLSARTIPTAPPELEQRAQRRPILTAPPAPTTTIAPDVVTAPSAGSQLSGIASTYCCTRGYSGQAVVALAGGLGGRYTGSINGYVTVCADRCARLPVVDYCQCYWGTSDQRLVDLSPEAWYAISDLPRSRGLISVRVTVES